jgi:predicted metal-dependent phosphoesterase TrpH
MLVDLHCHTCYSDDACTSLAGLYRACKRKGLDCVAITDHNEIEGARQMQRLYGLRVIVGEEIATSGGELIGLFLRERIEPGMSPEDTVDAIRDQGGIVYLPHPGAWGRKIAFALEQVPRVLQMVDVVEVFNARSRHAEDNRRAMDLAALYAKPCGAGSDAHSPLEIGNVLLSMRAYSDSADFVQCLAGSTFEGHPVPFALRALTNRYVRKAVRPVARRQSLQSAGA